MAIKKTIKDIRGQIVSYHRIASVFADFDNKVCYIKTAAYTDETYRADEKSATEPVNMSITTGEIRLQITDENFSRDNLYERIKAECDGWQDAEDC